VPGNHHVIDPGEPPLPFGDDFGLEAGIAVPWHRDFHRPGIGEHGLSPVAVAGIPAITAFRVMPAVAEMAIDLALQRACPAGPAGTGQAFSPGNVATSAPPIVLLAKRGR
jgi:hypothetical protein